MDEQRRREYSRARLVDTILSNAPSSVAYIDSDRRYRFANNRYLTGVRKSYDEVIGQRLEDIISEKHFDELWNHVDAALNGEEQSFEIRLGEDHPPWAGVQYIPDVRDDGKVLGFFAFIQDIDKLKTAQLANERLRHALERAKEGFAVHKVDGSFTFVNTAQAEMYGYTVEELLGRSWDILYSAGQTREIEDVFFPQLMENGAWKGELTGRRKDGEHFPVEVTLTVLQDNDGNFDGLIFNCNDITQRKIDEQALRQLQKTEAVGQLTGGIAHDFNNLLAVIVGNLHLALDQAPTSSEQHDLVEKAIAAAERGATLTNRLLAFARQQSLQSEILSLNEVVTGMNDLLVRSLGKKITVEVIVQPSTWYCRADPSAIENAILNLALNARDAMPDGGTLTLQTSNRPTPTGDTVVLSISDTGVGIPREALDRIFDPFFTTKEVGKGSGLGLSMVQGFITQSGGEVSVESRPGQGTTFEIVMPATAVSAIVADEVSETE